MGDWCRRAGFSLIELVIVIVIIGVLSAVAIPRITRGAQNARATALKADLATLRRAIETYRAEHDGLMPTRGDIVNQLTKYTNADGTSWSDTPDPGNGIIFGPYLTKVPALPVALEPGEVDISDVDGVGVGWIYDDATGLIRSNTDDSEVDSGNVKFNTY